MDSQMTYNNDKFKELLLYVATKLEFKPLGAVKINKIPFYSDFLAFANFGSPITGAKYIRKPLGPVASQMVPAVQELVEEKAAIEKEVYAPVYDKQRRLLALRKADLSKFTSDEIALVDEIIEICKDSTGKDMSELSHDFPGWQLIPANEEIPYSTISIPRDPIPLTQKEMDYGKKVAARLSKV